MSDMNKNTMTSLFGVLHIVILLLLLLGPPCCCSANTALTALAKASSSTTSTSNIPTKVVSATSKTIRTTGGSNPQSPSNPQTLDNPNNAYNARPSSDWWERLYEGGDGAEEMQGLQGLIRGQNQNQQQQQQQQWDQWQWQESNERPLNRRSHSAAIFRRTTAIKDSTTSTTASTTQKSKESAAEITKEENSTTEEWMIITGGFTDEDWNTFPVWAYDLSHAKREEDVFASSSSPPPFGSSSSTNSGEKNDNDDNKNNIINDNANTANESTTSKTIRRRRRRRQGPWIDLTGLKLGAVTTTSTSSSESLQQESLQQQQSSSISSQSPPPPPMLPGPEGRVGHLSSIHNGCLYIFGGLTYSQGSFHAEYDADGGVLGTMIVWRACGLEDYFVVDDDDDDDDEISGGVGSVDEQDGGGGKEDDGDNSGRRNGKKLLQWERIVPTVISNMPEQTPGTIYDRNLVENIQDNSRDRGGNKYRGGQSKSARRASSTLRPNGSSSHQSQGKLSHEQSKQKQQGINPALHLPRGEAQGGHYPKSTRRGSLNPRDSFIFYGGMHHDHVIVEDARASAANTEFPLGDVWKYEYDTETLTLLAPYPPLDWQRDERNGQYPLARTAHAGVIVGDELIIHGGMCTQNEQRSYGDYSTPSSSYESYYTSTPKWRPLSDIWVFDLVNLRWKERLHYPQLARSYHSLVGYGNSEVAAFGGYQQSAEIGGETLAFVFKDLIISRPNETHWKKLQPPLDKMPNWRTIQHYNPHFGISNRLEHSAVLDQSGSMFVWGGRFQTVRQISGMWRLDVFTADAKLNLEMAGPDGIEAYEEQLESLRMFIAVLMFTSFAMSGLFGVARRQEEGGGGGGTTILSSRRGVSREVIDSLPLKRYETHRSVTEEGDVVEDVSLSRENSREEATSGLEDAECCPICLIEYEEGCEIRTLPCGHYFCRECVDTWMASHTNCPSCRQTISRTPQESTSDGNDNETPDDIIDYNLQYIASPLHFFASEAFQRILRDQGRRDRRWFGPLEGHQSDNSEADEESESNNSVDVTPAAEPRLWGLRRLFRGGGNVGTQVAEDDAGESIELV